MIGLLFDLFVTSPTLGSDQPSRGRLLLAMLFVFGFVILFGLILVGELG